MRHVSIETNESFRDIALRRGRMSPDDIFIVRSAPNVDRFKDAEPDEVWRRGRKHLVGYIGIMGSQDGLDYLSMPLDLIIHEWKREDIQFVLVGRARNCSSGSASRIIEGWQPVEPTGLVTWGQQLGSIHFDCGRVR